MVGVGADRVPCGSLKGLAGSDTLDCRLMRVFTLLALVVLVAGACSDFERVKLTLQTPESIVREIEYFPVAQLPFFMEVAAEPRASWNDWGSAGALVSLAAGKLVNVHSAWRYSYEEPKQFNISRLDPSAQLLVESWDGFEAYTSWPLDLESRVLLFERSPYYVAYLEDREEVEKIARSFIEKSFLPDNIKLEDLFAALRLLRLCEVELDSATREKINATVLSRRVQSEGEEGFQSIYDIGVRPNKIDVLETMFGLLCLAQLESLPEGMLTAMWPTIDSVHLYQGEILEGSPLLQYAGMNLLHDLSWVSQPSPQPPR